MSIKAVFDVNTVTFYSESKRKNVTIQKSETYFTDIRNAIMDGCDESEIFKILKHQGKKFIEYLDNKVVFKDNTVYYKDIKFPQIIMEKLISLRDNGYKFDYMLKFLDKLWENPNQKSRDDLFEFLEHKECPITEDGDFLSVKAVTSDFKDIRSKTKDNRPGQLVKMKREDVNSDNTVDCGRGLHAGAIAYVKSYGDGNHDKYVLVKINPKHVVSVPKDCSCQKIRVCEYLVIKEIPYNELAKPLSEYVADNKTGLPIPKDYIDNIRNGKVWHTWEDDYLRKNYTKIGREEAAKKLNRSIDSVRRHWQRLQKKQN